MVRWETKFLDMEDYMYFFVEHIHFGNAFDIFDTTIIHYFRSNLSVRFNASPEL